MDDGMRLADDPRERLPVLGPANVEPVVGDGPGSPGILGSCLADVGRDDGRTLAHEPSHLGRALTAGSARDDDHLARDAPRAHALGAVPQTALS
jgi:hypothetical protein